MWSVWHNMAPRSSYCHWCLTTAPNARMVKLRDGPVDWYYCSMEHADLWVDHRGRKETRALCRMGPDPRRRYLGGRSMEEEISRLLLGTGCEVKEQ